MDPDSVLTALRVASWLDIEIDQVQASQLDRYHGWLASEAIRAGGVGPNEGSRLWQRHIADSLTFGIALSEAEIVGDIGSGVGLPGIPLAIAFPQLTFVLVDRSGRRCDLIRRAIAVLRLDNCEVVHSDIGAVDKQFDAIVSRAAIPLQDLLIHVKHLLKPGGTAVIGISRAGNMPANMSDDGSGLSMELVEVPIDILDTPAKLLRIGAT